MLDAGTPWYRHWVPAWHTWVGGDLGAWWHGAWIQVRGVQTNLGYPGGRQPSPRGDGHQEMMGTQEPIAPGAIEHQKLMGTQELMGQEPMGI